MGCAVCKAETTTENERESSSPVAYSVPFGHVPYTPSLPAAMGPIWKFPIEWWYYVGWATDDKGNRFTIMMDTLRDKAIAGILYGIGIDREDVSPVQQSFVTNCTKGNGSFPSPTSMSWQIQCSDGPKIKMACKLTVGILGLPGASYVLELMDNVRNITANLVLKDNFGMVFEGTSGAYVEEGSYEYAAPCLAIQNGSTITINGECTQIVDGNIWLDRQMIKDSERSQIARLDQPSASGETNPLYFGNWLAVVMNDGTVYNLVFFWPKKEKLWIAGTKLTPPIPPTKTIGLEYSSLNTWDKSSPVQGVNILKSDEFDLNLLDPSDTETTPHWTSPASGNTYGTAWQLYIKGQTYTMKALIPGSEVLLGLQYIYEGAASLTNELDIEVGHAFIEQMGYN